MTSNMWTKSAVCPSDGVKPQSTKNRSVSGSTPSGSISCSHRPKLRSCLEVRGLTGTTAPTVAPRSSSQNSEFDVFLCRTRRVTSLPSSSVPATRVVSASDPYLSTCLSCSFRASFTTSSAMTTMSSRSSRKNSPDAHSGALTPYIFNPSPSARCDWTVPSVTRVASAMDSHVTCNVMVRPT